MGAARGAGAGAGARQEPPQGRRLNVLGALAPCGRDPWLVWESTPGKRDAAAFLDFLWHGVARLATAVGEVSPGYRRARPLVVVLDNYSVHRSKMVKAAEACSLAGSGCACSSCRPTAAS